MKTLIKTIVLLTILLVGPMALAQDNPNQDVYDLYASGQNEDALAMGLLQLEQDPESRDLNQIVGRCLVDLDRAEEGKPYLQKVVDTGIQDWRYAWSLNYLGYVAWRAGDDETATKAWIEVRDGKLTKNVAKNAKNALQYFGLAESFADWTKIKTAHCIFYFSPLHAELDLQNFADKHERAYLELTEYFGSETPYPVRYIVWGSMDEARQMNGITSLGFARPRNCLIHCRSNQTVGHELTHVVSGQALKPTVKTRLINEGVAVYFDLSGRDRMAKARYAVQKANVTDLDLLSWWTDERSANEEVLYPVAGAWVKTLLDKGGKDKLFKLCREQTAAKAREIYGDDLDVWVDEFEQALVVSAQTE